MSPFGCLCQGQLKSVKFTRINQLSCFYLFHMQDAPLGRALSELGQNKLCTVDRVMIDRPPCLAIQRAWS